MKVIEAIFSNKPCYLAEPAWQDALRRCVLDKNDFSDRSETSLELSVISSRVPNVFQAVSNIIHYEEHDIKSVKRVVERLHQDLRNWSNSWRDTLEWTCRNPLSESTIRHQSLTILLTYYMLSAIVCRLRISISPFDSLDIEEETVSSCIGVLSLRRFTMRCETPSHFRGSIYCRTTAGTHATSANWKRTIDTALSGDIVDAELFDQWCSMIEREPHGVGGDLLSNHAEGV